MELIFETMGWFSVEQKPNTTDISVLCSDGNRVTLEIRKISPYSKHLKNLITELKKLEEK
jgi:hypothetical protein